MKKYIDLRSDTVTQPTQEMRDAMYCAEVGDDVFQDDPTINELERLAAARFGKKDGVFVPSGTFSNQLALFTHCSRGDEVILDKNAHIVIHESGASSIIAGVQLFTLDGDGGVWDLVKFEAAIKAKSRFTPGTKLVCMENAFNGHALKPDYMEKVFTIAKRHGLAIHLDGARIFNAAAALHCDVKALSCYADTVSICLSKGLAAPVGTVLVGSHDFCERAKDRRKLMGGGMRQAGFLAAAGIVALSKMTERLVVDHEHAAYLETLLLAIPGITVDPTERDINMVFWDIADERKHGLLDHLFQNGVKILPWEGTFRFVTHLDVTKADLDRVAVLLRAYFA
ncbi:MAG: low-specificity L-threonine aldolase [Bacillota bacterium]|nr:low-specificity L-threonine aldolase [Bacillota bacterium]